MRVITLLKLTPYTDATVLPSPNRGIRKALAIEGIILHATADEGNEAGTLTWLRSRKSRASCHLFVSRSGEVTRLVGDHQRAWHAGVSWFKGTSDVNSITLGIEIANRNDGEPYTDAQYHRVAEVVAHYCRQGLSLDDVVSHESIADERRTDPFGWDWARFRAMVQSILHATDPDARRWIYDRRSGKRLALDDSEIPDAAIELAGVATDRARVTARVTAEHRIRPPSNARVTPVGTSRVRISALTDPKPVLCSRTIWLNGLTVFAAGGVLVGQILDIAFQFGLDLPREITIWALFAVGVVNIMLRFQTRCPIGGNIDKSEPPASGVTVTNIQTRRAS